MDKTIFSIEGFGEYGLDLEASPGNGAYYVKLYDGSHNSCGFESEKEAREELEYLHAEEYPDGVHFDRSCTELDDLWS